MASFADSKFENTTVILGSNQYFNCVFVRCRLIYDGSGNLILRGCSFDSCSWDFTGPAANTVDFLSSLYVMPPTGYKTVENLFNYVRNKAKAIRAIQHPELEKKKG